MIRASVNDGCSSVLIKQRCSVIACNNFLHTSKIEWNASIYLRFFTSHRFVQDTRPHFVLPTKEESFLHKPCFNIELTFKV